MVYETLRRGFFPAMATLWALSGIAAPAALAESPAPFEAGLSYGGRDLVLRSASLKEASVFKADVYWVGLYLEAVDTPADSIIGSNQVKAFVFHFLRNVKSADLQESWIENLTEACVSDCRPVIAQGTVLARKLPDVRPAQEVVYILFPDRVEVLIDGEVLGRMVGESATRALLATILGPTAPLKLRKDLFGSRMPSAR